MDDLAYILGGYGATAGALIWYRWRLSRRAQRARELTEALSRRPPRSRGGAR